jgi:hypothetical protein
MILISVAVLAVAGCLLALGLVWKRNPQLAGLVLIASLLVLVFGLLLITRL